MSKHTSGMIDSKEFEEQLVNERKQERTLMKAINEKVGNVFASPEVATKRFNTCLKCPHLQTKDTLISRLAKRAHKAIVPFEMDFADKFTCGKCGCPLKAKIQYLKAFGSKTSCPLGKWEE